MTTPRTTCPHCRRTDVRITQDGYLYKHRRGARRSVWCDSGGMAAPPPEALTSHLGFLKGKR